MGRYTGSRLFSGHFSTLPLDDKVNTESLVQYLDEYLSIEGFPDYSHAYNGLQVEGPTEVRRVAVAVDSSEAVIREAASRDVDILIVHHGLFWDGLAKIVGPRFRKIRALIEGKVALYSAHLPLDAHAEVGNCAVLCRALGWSPEERFGAHQGHDIGWSCEVDYERDALVDHVGGLFPAGRITSIGLGWSLVGPPASFPKRPGSVSMRSSQGREPITPTTTPWSTV